MNLPKIRMPAMKFFRISLALATVSMACLGLSEAPKKVLGKLGQTVRSATIHSSATSRSHIYYRVRPYEYLVLQNSSNKNYTKVLLQNGRFGYIRRDAVAELPYEVTQGQSQQEATPPIDPSPTRDPGSQTARGAAANWGLKFIGTPYQWGGNDPTRGVDCSGFVKYLYGQIGINLPRTAAEQATVGQPIHRLEDLQSGDRLYFWDAKRGKIGHTGVYLGNGYFVHSSSGKGAVTTDYLGAQKWRAKLVAARR